MAKKIFVWVGHPRHTSLSHAMADAYIKAAETGGAEVRRMNLSDMVFDPDLTEGYHQRKVLEPCLETWRDNITWADHLAWIFPQWWGHVPAKMKGVIDRAFLPGFAMNYHDDDPFWDPLLKGRSADIIMTSDQPYLYDLLRHRTPAMKAVKNLTLKFSGIRPVRTLQVGTVKGAKEKTLNKWIGAAEKRGRRAARG